MRIELKTRAIEIDDKIAEKIKMNTPLNREDFLTDFYVYTCPEVEKSLRTWGTPLPSLDEMEERFFKYVDSVGLETVLNEMAFDGILRCYIDMYGGIEDFVMDEILGECGIDPTYFKNKKWYPYNK